jgi:hypothetical protein
LNCQHGKKVIIVTLKVEEFSDRGLEDGSGLSLSKDAG